MDVVCDGIEFDFVVVVSLLTTWCLKESIAFILNSLIHNICVSVKAGNNCDSGLRFYLASFWESKDLVNGVHWENSRKLLVLLHLAM